MTGDAQRIWWLLPLLWCLLLLASLIPALVLEPYLEGAWPLADTGLALVSVAVAASFFIFTAWPFWIAFAARGAAAGVAYSALELLMLLVLAVPFFIVAGNVAEVGPENIAAGMVFLLGLGIFSLGIRALWQGLGLASGRWLLALLFVLAMVPVILNYLFQEIIGRELEKLSTVSPLHLSYICTSEGFTDSAYAIVIRFAVYPAIGIVLAVISLAFRRIQPKDVVE